jgi:mono/diheme cytochrome c family protein
MPGPSSESPEVAAISLSGSPVKGQNVFVNKGCIGCHAVWGAGGRTGPDLARLGMGKSYLQIAGALWNHSPEMIDAMRHRGAERPLVTSEEMGDFINYLYYMNYYGEAGSAVEGRRLFAEKGCAACHSIGGSGGSAGPPLDDYSRYRNPIFVAQAMWNHDPQMSATMQANGIEKPYLEGKQAADLLAFIRGQTASEVPGDKFMLPGSPAAGRRLFVEKGCAACHGLDGGAKTSAPELTKTSAYKSVVEIAGAMWNHSARIWAQMQQAGVARPTFGGTEMADIVSYIYFLRYVDEPGDATAGKRLFTSKGCAGCHSNVSSFNRSAAFESPATLMATMWNHAPLMQRLTKEKGFAWPIFYDNEMRDLIEYLKRPAASTEQAVK